MEKTTDQPLSPSLEQRFKALRALQFKPGMTKHAYLRLAKEAMETELIPASRAAKDLPEGHPDRAFADSLFRQGVDCAIELYLKEKARQGVALPTVPTAADLDDFMVWAEAQSRFMPDPLEQVRRPSLGQPTKTEK